jgi:hypothetical protein
MSGVNESSGFKSNELSQLENTSTDKTKRIFLIFFIIILF